MQLYDMTFGSPVLNRIESRVTVLLGHFSFGQINFTVVDLQHRLLKLAMFRGSIELGLFKGSAQPHDVIRPLLKAFPARH